MDKRMLLVLAIAGTAPAGAAQIDYYARTTRAFGCDLYRALRARDGDLCISPCSVAGALAMVQEGADRTTLLQMQKVLHLPECVRGPIVPWPSAHAVRLAQELQPESVRTGGDGVPAHRLRIAKAVWGDRAVAFSGPFLATLAEQWRSPLASVDFSEPARAREVIDAWVRERTDGRIAGIMPPELPRSHTRLAVVDAVWFSAAWAHPFRASATREQAFTTLAGRARDVPTMHQVARFRYAENETLQALEMPYRGGQMAFVVLLPRAADGLPALEAELTQPHLDAVLGELRPRPVSVSLPRFEAASALDLAATLAAMGMPDAFDGATADFSNMTRSPSTGAERVSLGPVLHEAKIAVVEEGTEAGAATIAPVEEDPSGEPVSFAADHPFLYLVRHRQTGALLFLGRFRGQ